MTYREFQQRLEARYPRVQYRIRFQRNEITFQAEITAADGSGILAQASPYSDQIRLFSADGHTFLGFFVD